MKRILNLTILVCACLTMMGAGWRSGNSFGGSLPPGFRAAQRSVSSSGPSAPALPTAGLLGLWLATDYDAGTGSWTEHTGLNRTFFQTVSDYRPAASGGLVCFDGTDDRVNCSQIPAQANGSHVYLFLDYSVPAGKIPADGAAIWSCDLSQSDGKRPTLGAGQKLCGYASCTPRLIESRRNNEAAGEVANMTPQTTRHVAMLHWDRGADLRLDKARLARDCWEGPFGAYQYRSIALYSLPATMSEDVISQVLEYLSSVAQ